MKTEFALVILAVIVVGIVGFQVYSLFAFSSSTPVSSSRIALPANIQSSAPMHFSSFEEEVAYYKKNAKNPHNIDVEQAVRNMDNNLDGVCDSCGMAILHCIESGMQDM